jgi:hypothetical protein
VEFVENNPDAEPDEGGIHDGTEPVEDPSGTDQTGPAGGPEDARDPLRFSNWMKRSATGAVMTGIAVGLREALQPQNREAPFVIEAKGEPDDPDRPIDLHFDPDSPADTVAFIRRPAPEAPPEP